MPRAIAPSSRPRPSRGLRRAVPWAAELRPSALALAVAALIATSAVRANPSGAQVVHGQATLTQQGRTLTVTTSDGAIINWRHFGIGADETTRFVQPAASSQVLNRVVGGDPSTILGRLESNGRVFLINPNGVAFGRGAQVDVAGLVVSTLRLSDSDFQAGRLAFGEPGAGASAGAIRHEGRIATPAGGFVYLVAPQVDNSGIVHTPEGQVILAAGHRVSLVNPRTPEVAWEISAPPTQAVNLGEVVSRQIVLQGAAVRNAGTLHATTAVRGEDGQVLLRAAGRIEQSAEGRIVARGIQPGGGQRGGLVDVLAGEQALLQGRIDVGAAPVPAPPRSAPQVPAPPEREALGGGLLVVGPAPTRDSELRTLPVWSRRRDELGGEPVEGGFGGAAVLGPAGSGGQLRVFGRDIVLGAGLAVEASGPAGGGKVLVGGELQGAFGGAPNAYTLRMDATARIAADATDTGPGGYVILWADDTTRAHGHISARGGPQGGDGGFIETSGRRMLEVTRPADASAPRGRPGTWLLDPNDIEIVKDPPNENVQVTDSDVLPPTRTVDTTDDTARVTASTIKAALEAGSNVVVSTGTLGTNAQPGNITVSAAIDVAQSGSGERPTLKLLAHNDIYVRADIGAQPGGPGLNVDLVAGKEGNEQSRVVFGDTSLNLGAGVLTANRPARIDPGATFAFQGGENSFLPRLDISGGATLVVPTLSSLGVGTLELVAGASLRVGGIVSVFGTLSTTPGNGNGPARMLGDGGGGEVVVGEHGQLQLGVNTTLGDALTFTQRGGANGGSVIDGGVELSFDNASLVNRGTLVLRSGNLALAKTATTGTLENQGLLQVDAGQQSVPSFVVDLSRVTNVSGGTLEVKSGRLQVSGLSDNEGLIRLQGSSKLSSTESLANRGTLSGNGTLALAGGTLTNGGVMQPGDTGSVGTLTVEGDLVLGPASLLDLEVKGLSSHDQLRASGTVTLGGTLQVSRLGEDFTPTHGDSMPLVTGAVSANSRPSIAIAPGFGLSGHFVYEMGQALVLAFAEANTAVFSNFQGNRQWSQSLNWSGTGPPTDSSRVLLVGGGQDRASSATVVLSSAVGTAQTVADLTLREGAELQLDFANPGLLVSGATSVSGGAGFNLFDGTLTLLGNYTSRGGSLRVSGGTLAIAAVADLDGETAVLGAAPGGRTSRIEVRQNGSLDIGSIAFNGQAVLSGQGEVQARGLYVLNADNVVRDHGLLKTTGNGGNGTVVEGTLDITGGRTWVNTGGILVSGMGRIRLGGESGFTLLRNEGGISLQGSNETPLESMGSDPRLENLGTLRKFTTSKQSTNVELVNRMDSLLEVHGGSLTATSVDHQGELVLNSGTGFGAGSFVLRGPGKVYGNGGTFTVDGSFERQGGVVGTLAKVSIQQTSGDLRPGLIEATQAITLETRASTGALVIDGALVTTGGGSSISLVSAGQLRVEAPVTTAGQLTLTPGAFSLATQTATGSLKAGSLLMGRSNGRYGLDISAGNEVGTIAGSGVEIRYLNKNALIIGAVGTASGLTASGAGSTDGTIRVETLAGDLTLASDVTAANGFAGALLLGAGRSEAAGSAAGGNIVLAGAPTVSVGAGGRGTLYTGSVAGSTGLAGLVGLGSGRFRYHSDETTTNFSDALGAGLHAIYREQPVLSVTPGAQSITYGTQTPTSFSAAYGGFVNGDASPGTVSGSANWEVGGANSSAGFRVAGTHDVRYLSGLASGLGYGLANATGSTGELTVTQRMLGVTQVSAADKVYDATTVASLSGGAVQPLAGDGVTLSADQARGSFGDKNAGRAKAVTASGYTISGADAGNYLLVQPGDLQADITPAVIAQVTGIAARDKVYDATTRATLEVGQAQFEGRLGSDELKVAAATGSFGDKNAGRGKAVSVTGIELGGADAGNYTLASRTAAAQAEITPREVAVGSLVVADKVYDGTTTARVREGTVDGTLAGDLVALSVSDALAAFADRRAGTNKTVNVSGLGLAGADARNYRLGSTSAQANASIAPKGLGLGSLSVADKVYDGTTVATVAGGNLDGVMAGDAVALELAGALAHFADKHAGRDKAVAVSGLAISGADASNYRLDATSGSARAAISVRPQSTWLAAAGGNWSDPANWDVMPEAANVATAVLPAAAAGAVTFDAAAPAVALQGLSVGRTLVVAAAGLSAQRIDNAAGIEVAAGASWDILRSLVSGAGVLANRGTLTLVDTNLEGRLSNDGGTVALGGTSRIGEVANAGRLTVLPAASVSILGAYRQSAGATILGAPGASPPTLRLPAGASLEIEAGDLAGTGTLEAGVVMGAARLAPGHSPGALAIGGNLRTSAQTLWDLELGGSALPDFDYLSVGGAVTLGGTIRLTSHGGFLANGSERIVFMTGGGLEGAYSTFVKDDPLLEAFPWSSLLIASPGGLVSARPVFGQQVEPRLGAAGRLGVLPQQPLPTPPMAAALKGRGPLPPSAAPLDFVTKAGSPEDEAEQERYREPGDGVGPPAPVALSQTAERPFVEPRSAAPRSGVRTLEFEPGPAALPASPATREVDWLPRERTDSGC